MSCAGLLLTGGRSTRMGRDKATIAIPGEVPWGSGQTDRALNGAQTTPLAERSAHLLEQATEMVLEVGPGFTRLDRVSDLAPNNGPLAAFVAGAAELDRLGWQGPILLVATDLPGLNSGMLGWLATHEPGRSVVPLAGGRPQPLCARYEPDAVAIASRLVAEGERSMIALIDAAHPQLVPEEVWLPFAGDPHCLEDVDTPDELLDYTRRTRYTHRTRPS